MFLVFFLNKTILLSLNYFQVKMNDSLNEKTLLWLSSIRMGDKRAFDNLFQAFYPMLCAYCHKLVSLEDAEEIVQDCLVWVWESRETGFLIESPVQYFFRMVYHRALDRIASHEVKQRAENVFFQKMQKRLEETDYYQMEELTRLVREAIRALPPFYREVFKMHRFQEMTYQEIGDALGISPKTVAYRIQQALKLLRTGLKDYLFNIVMML